MVMNLVVLLACTTVVTAVLLEEVRWSMQNEENFTKQQGRRKTTFPSPSHWPLLDDIEALLEKDNPAQALEVKPVPTT